VKREEEKKKGPKGGRGGGGGVNTIKTTMHFYLQRITLRLYKLLILKIH